MNPVFATSVDCATVPLPRRATAWLRTGARVVVISALFGAILGVIESTLAGFVDELVYSVAIGASIYVVMTLVGLVLRMSNQPRSFADYLLRGLFAVPIGLFVGLNAGAFLRGNPVGLAVLNRAAFLALPFTVVASAGIMYVLWSRKRMADVATLQADTQRQMAEARLRLLQAQIEPHMLFNTLANLRSLVVVDAPRAQTMIDQLIVYLRGTLAASRGATSTTLEAEFAQLGAYLALMQVRMAHRLDFTLDLPDALRTTPVPPMLLQPLVENAIKHGLEPKIEGGSIRVSASSTDGRLTIAVSDDGIGLDAHGGVDSGYGLEHVRERLRTLYGEAASLSIVGRPEGGVRAVVDAPGESPR